MTAAITKISLSDALEKRKDILSTFLGDSKVMERFVKVAIFSITSNPTLQECTLDSLVLSVMKLAEIGLEPGGVLAEAHLVPYRNKRGQLEAQPIPDYKGLVRVARDSGSLKDIKAVVVHANDVFEWEEGSDGRILHRPVLRDPGGPIAVYSVASLADGVKTWLVMPWDEVMRVKAASRAASAGPWVQWPEEMAKKAVIKRHSKVLPRRGKFLKALALEDQAESGEDPEAPEEPPKSRVAEVAERVSRKKAPKPEPEDALIVCTNEYVGPLPPDDMLLPGQPGYVPPDEVK